MLTISLLKLDLVILAVLLCIDYAITAKIIARIVGGTDTTVATNPYLVSLLLNNGTDLNCGGSLVQPRHVITAAHCIIGLLPRNLTVRGGSSFYNSDGTLRQVIRIARPGIYNDNTLDMDVAALKLRLDMTGPNIAVIPLCGQRLNTSNFVKVSGWGQVSETNDTAPIQMRTVTLQIISNSACSTKFSDVDNATVTDNMLCAGSNALKGACSGDSGGALVYTTPNNVQELCGIVSWGTNCDLIYPTVFTRINSDLVRGFITRQTNDTIIMQQ